MIFSNIPPALKITVFEQNKFLKNTVIFKKQWNRKTKLKQN